MNVLAILIGFLSGIISGMGIGGGTILIPSVTLFLSVAQKSAQAINLIYFIPTAISALVIHFREKTVLYKTGLWIIGFGIIGAVIGSMAAVYLDQNILRIIFAIFMLIVGLSEIFKK